MTKTKQVTVVGEELAKKIAKDLNSKTLQVKYIPILNRTFPDSEVQPRLEKDLKTEVAILAIDKLEGETINDYLVRFYLITANIRPKVKQLIAVMPYLPYARQDKAFRKGEPLSFELIANIISSNVDEFITVNPHEHRLLMKNVFKVPVRVVSAFPALGAEFSKEDLVIGPDGESAPFVKEFVSKTNLQTIVFNKVRNVATGTVKFTPPKGVNVKATIKDRNIVLVDDVIASGRTILQLMGELMRDGAHSISLAFVHNMTNKETSKKLLTAGFKKILTTDTLPSKFKKISVAEYITDFLKEYLNN
ncbi:MAG TPA: ribose-phosphate diphosphokinase [Candidatus Paceibacterota bacterium]|nr:ribose-phosphate diphosphokinase [Candidatus Paceibacterota bacterium]